MLQVILDKSLVSSGCPICGGKLVMIRGKYPGNPQREVCPTCLQERMDYINELSSRDYNTSRIGVKNGESEMEEGS